MGTSSKELDRKLRKLAKKQHGCFTAAQAVETGYADSVHLYHIKNGQWIRVFRGVYRFADVSETPAVRCMAALLWTRDKNGKIQGFLPAETEEALRSGSISANQPIQIHVPRGFRRTSNVPDGIQICFVEKPSRKTSKIKDFTSGEKAQRPAIPLPDGFDASDYYDWLDYQSVLCEKSS